MRRFAQINSGLVERVIVAESAEWCVDVLGGIWVETFKNRSQRVHFASPGFIYDKERDAFIPPRPFESWVINETTFLWEAPIPYPEDGNQYSWDEEVGNWVEMEA